MVTDKKLNGLLDKFWANIKTEINNKGIAISNQHPKTNSIKSDYK
jgi:hypothetical protein